ncbi:protein translocase subunit SecF [Syntrophomonas palmitatica]|uniref:protein translocase subunit SecF n=1 Tax=Syntrophomonas palmitatica TaxID=402877 RepID=UPI0006CF3218|nr:protein translocase subunit SecF [Syntrophomonas palmitatica]
MKFLQMRKYFYILSLIIIIPGLVSLFSQGLNLGIDFKGGSILQVKMDSDVTAGEVRSALKELKLEKAEVTRSGDEFFIRTVELDQAQTRELLNTLKTKFKNVEFLSAESVGATIGRELTNKALLAVLAAAIAMLIYITIRFEWTFGVAAVIAELHDILFVLGLFSLFQWEVNTPFIAAMLTIVGYSINDTIVIFDRIRENLRMKKKEDYMSLVNRSITQSLNRSINTVLTCVFALVALLVFGGTTIKIFVLTMLIGFIIGCYSSIFVASPLWYDIKNKA